MFEFTLLLIFPAAMAFAGALDLLTMTIPNRISVALAAAFAFAAYRAGLPFDVVAAHLAAAAMVLAVGIVFFAFGWLGGGDAKLMSVAALWIVGTQLWFTATIADLDTTGGAPHLLFAHTVFGKGVSYMGREIKCPSSPISDYGNVPALSDRSSPGLG